MTLELLVVKIMYLPLIKTNSQKKNKKKLLGHEHLKYIESDTAGVFIKDSVLLLLLVLPS